VQAKCCAEVQGCHMVLVQLVVYSCQQVEQLQATPAGPSSTHTSTKTTLQASSVYRYK
jgi:hypothetical protein